MKEKTFENMHPKPLPGFEIGYYPSEWLYWDHAERQPAGDTLSGDTEV